MNCVFKFSVCFPRSTFTVQRIFGNFRPQPKFTLYAKRFFPSFSLSVCVLKLPWLSVAYCKRKNTSKSLINHSTRQNELINTSFGYALKWTDLWKLLHPDLLLLLSAVAAAFVVALINIKLPLLLGQLINAIAALSSLSEFGNLRKLSFQLIFHFAAQGALTFLYISLLTVVGERVAYRLRLRLFSSLIMQDISFFDVHRTGELIGRLAGDVQEFKSALKQCISQGLRSCTQVIGCMISMWIMSPRMAIITCFAIPTVVLVGTAVGAILRHMSALAQEQISQSIQLADEALGNIRTVRSFGMEEEEIRKFEAEVQKSKLLGEELGIGIGLFQGLSNFLMNGMVLGVLYGGAFLLCRHEISPGDLMSYMVTSQTVQRSLAQVSVLFGEALKGLTAGSRVFEYINLKPFIPIKEDNRISDLSLIGDIEFKNVTFSYPSRPDQTVLKDFSLHIPLGKIVALVGPSGSGKSTVSALMERFYDITDGGIFIDDVEIRYLDPQWIRQYVIGTIAQEPVLFSGTVRENIRYGRPGASEQEIIEAAKNAQAYEFISNFPDGLDTVVGERGLQLSGGQKQRIAIARALLMDPKVLVLDEATSALDAESERLVQKALDAAVKGRSVLLIAHRLSTVRNADVIAVVRHGHIIERGTHEELLAEKGFYWNLVRHQTDDNLID